MSKKKKKNNKVAPVVETPSSYKKDVSIRYEQMIADCTKADLATSDGIKALERKLSSRYQVRELLTLLTFETIERFTFKTSPDKRNFYRLMDTLVRKVNRDIGAAAILETFDAKRAPGAFYFIDEGNGPSILDYTLNELEKAIRKAKDKFVWDMTEKEKRSRRGLDKYLNDLQHENEKLSAKLKKLAASQR